jgi:hypothetical protein
LAHGNPEEEHRFKVNVFPSPKFDTADDTLKETGILEFIPVVIVKKYLERSFYIGRRLS